jgi:para-nitrobenzyl esterase
MTDYTFLFPSLRFAEAAHKAGSHTWVYQLDWAPPGSSLKACHGIEVPLVFGNMEVFRDAPMLQGANSEVIADLSTAISSAWIGFIRTGKPDVSIPWLSYEPNQRKTMRYASVIGAVGDLANINRFY